MSVRDGIVVIDKPAGLTSHDVVDRVRRIAGTRRVGHAGTLDPMATGVLVVGVGRATRLLGHLSATDKTYEATIRLGATTSTDDAEGQVLARTPAGDLDAATVRSAVARFVGPLDQVPTSVSAIRVDGERAHVRVRRGEQLDMPARRVQVHEFDVGSLHVEGEHADVDVGVCCSSGTYVRALARDLGVALGVGGHLLRLRRTAVGAFTVDDARTLERLAEGWQAIDPATAAALAFPSLSLEAVAAERVRHGARLERLQLPAAAGPVALLSPDGDLLALYTQRGADAIAIAVFVG